MGNAAVIWNAEATKGGAEQRRSASRGKSITMSMKDIAGPSISPSGIHSKIKGKAFWNYNVGKAVGRKYCEYALLP